MNKEEHSIINNDESILLQIRELNLNALLLAQSVLKNDFNDGLLRFGVEKSTGEFIVGLSFAQIQMLSKVPYLLFPIKLDHKNVSDILNKNDEQAKVLTQFIICSATKRVSR